MPPADTIFLTGFMATGKTAVGRAVAARLGRCFVDTDVEIEREAGTSIAEIFRCRGEGAFRALERRTVEGACAQAEAVVATGGGAIVDPVNLEHMRAAGAIVCLTARPEVILARVGSADDRPLLGAAADRRARIRDLLSERAGAYAAADWTLDTSDLTPEDAAAAIEAWWRGRNLARVTR